MFEYQTMHTIHHKKLDYIRNNPTPISIKRIKPLFEFKNKMQDGGLTREQKLELIAGNKYLKNKLSKQSSLYSLKKWVDDFGKTQHFKRNICEFPSIDFYHTHKNSAFGGGFYNPQKIANYTKFDGYSSIYFNRTKFKKINPAIKNKTNEKSKKEIIKSEKENEKSFKKN